MKGAFTLGVIIFGLISFYALVRNPSYSPKDTYDGPPRNITEIGEEVHCIKKMIESLSKN